MPGAVVGVLQVAPRGTHRVQRSHHLCGLHAVAGLGVDRDGHLDAPDDPPGRGEHLVGRCALTVLEADAGGHAPAGGSDHRESGSDHRSGRGGVPHVRQQERVAGTVQRSQQLAPFRESGRVGGHGDRTSLGQRLVVQRLSPLADRWTTRQSSWRLGAPPAQPVTLLTPNRRHQPRGFGGIRGRLGLDGSLPSRPTDPPS